MNKSLLWITGLAATLSFNSCDKADDPKKNLENELITKVHLHLETINGTDTILAEHAKWLDLTPDDPEGREIDTLMLDTGKVYYGSIELIDHSKNPELDITEEVEAEKDDHLFIYRQDPVESSVKFTIDSLDKDNKGLPVGLKFRLKTTNISGISKLNVILKHQPGVKNISESQGDTDLDIWFPVKIR